MVFDRNGWCRAIGCQQRRGEDITCLVGALRCGPGGGGRGRRGYVKKTKITGLVGIIRWVSS
jgi:hypothetical protein